MILVKNPTGFTQVIEYLSGVTSEYDLLCCLNDKPQDGTDISWIWDAPLEALSDNGNHRWILRLYLFQFFSAQTAFVLSSTRPLCELGSQTDQPDRGEHCRQQSAGRMRCSMRSCPAEFQFLWPTACWSLRYDHAVPQYLPVLLQILLPHPSVLAQGLHLGLGKGQVRDQVIPGLRVVQIFLHGTVSFLPVPAGLLRVHSS